MADFNKIEGKILSALRHSLHQEIISEESVLADMLKQVGADNDETSHHSQFRWEGIDDAFNLKMAGSPHKDAVTSAFYAVHTYKYLDDPTFKLSLERDLRQRAVPDNEIQNAMKHVDTLVTELGKNPGERDSGWSPNLKDLVDLTSNADSRSPSQDQPFTGGGHWPKDDKNDPGSLEGFTREDLKFN